MNQKSSFREDPLFCLRGADGEHVGATGQPQKSKVHKMCSRLVEEKLLERRGNKYRITPKGKREIGWTDDDDD